MRGPVTGTGGNPVDVQDDVPVAGTSELSDSRDERVGRVRVRRARPCARPPHERRLVLRRPLGPADVDERSGALHDGTSALELHEHWEYALVVLRGTVAVEGRPVEPGKLAYLGTGRQSLERDTAEPTTAVLLGGEPLGEELVMWWNVGGRNLLG